MTERQVLVKICGVRTLEGAQAGVDAGADLLGFICYPPARRYLPPDGIQAILQNLRSRSSIRAVGVFVNQPVEEMKAVAALCGLDLIQLSGDEPSEGIGLLDRPVIEAFRPTASPLPNPSPNPGGGANVGARPLIGWTGDMQHWTSTFADLAPPPGLGEGLGRGLAARAALFAALLEPRTAGWGGGGQQLDWSIARAITDLAARPPVFLAGGLRPENVARAIAAVRPEGVDVSSGVEKDGVQDIARIAAFVTAAKGVGI